MLNGLLLCTVQMSKGIVVAADMNYFYHSLINCTERQRIHLIEPFDEFEEWNLKCAHYIILTSFSGVCKSVAPVVWPELVTHCGPDVFTNSWPTLVGADYSQTRFNQKFKKLEINKSNGHFLSVWNLTDKECHSDDDDSDCVVTHGVTMNARRCGVVNPTQTELSVFDDRFDGCCRYGHSATKLVLGGNEYVVVLGGFGLSLLTGCHGRISEPTALSFKGKDIVSCQVECRLASLARMYHTTCVVNDNRLIIVGGRYSPMSLPGELVVSVEFPSDSLDQVDYEPISTKGQVPECRWRHSTTRVTVNGIICFIYHVFKFKFKFFSAPLTP